MKKICFFLTIISIFITFSFISCASTPKTNAEKVNEELFSDQNTQEESTLTSQTEESQEENTPSLDDYSDLEEKIIPDELSELPADKEEKQEPEETVFINEPIVKDEPEVELQPQKEEFFYNDKNTNSSVSAKNQEDFENSNAENEEDENFEHTNEFALNLNNNNSEKNYTNQNDTNQDYTNQNDSEISSSSIDQDKSYETEEDEETEEEPYVPPTPSRTVTVLKNQTLDITYPGKGWIYQGNIDSEGELDNRNKNFIFGGRKLGGKDQEFTLRSRNPGTYLLHFFKNDPLTGKYIDDYLEVKVLDKNSNDANHVKAPSYAEIVPPKVTITAEKIKQEAKQKKLEEQKANETKQKEENASELQEKSSASQNEKPQNTPFASEIDTIIQTSSTDQKAQKNSTEQVQKNPVSQNNTQTQATSTQQQAKTENPAVTEVSLDELSDDELLEKAKKFYSSKSYKNALDAVEKFLYSAASRIDEALYLKGQILEAKSSVQNIKNAIESYDLVVQDFPASSLWDAANKRSIFLKRFYINIR